MIERNKLPKADLATSTYILEKAISLFAAKGYLGVSMRDLAREVGITPAALYHHFPNKESLHLAAVLHAYKSRTTSAVDTLRKSSPETAPLARLEKFLVRLCTRFSEEPEFRLLVQRSIMDAETDDEVRRVLVDNLYRENFRIVEELLAEINPALDAHLMCVSIYGMVMHVYGTSHIRRGLPSHRPEHENPEFVARHLLDLLLKGILPAG